MLRRWLTFLHFLIGTAKTRKWEVDEADYSGDCDCDSKLNHIRVATEASGLNQRYPTNNRLGCNDFRGEVGGGI